MQTNTSMHENLLNSVVNLEEKKSSGLKRDPRSKRVSIPGKTTGSSLEDVVIVEEKSKALSDAFLFDGL